MAPIPEATFLAASSICLSHDSLLSILLQAHLCYKLVQFQNDQFQDLAVQQSYLLFWLSQYIPNPPNLTNRSRHGVHKGGISKTRNT